MSAENPNKVKVDSELAKDPNYIAYKEQEATLKAEHMDEWVAYADGKLVTIQKSEEELFGYLKGNYPQTGAFVHHIVEVEPIIHLGAGTEKFLH